MHPKVDYLPPPFDNHPVALALILGVIAAVLFIAVLKKMDQAHGHQ